jgi:hypothetical protein
VRPETKIGRPQKIKRPIRPFSGIAKDPLFEGKFPAGIRPVGIDRATRIRQKDTAPIACHPEEDVRKVIVLSQDDIEPLLDKPIRIDGKPFLQPDDIVRIDKKIQIPAAPVKAGKSGPAIERERLPFSEASTGDVFKCVCVEKFHFIRPR